MVTPYWMAKYLGIPHKKMGRARDGADNWGLIRIVYYDQFGYSLPTFTEKDKGPKEARSIMEYIDKEFFEIMYGRERPGDLIVFELPGNKYEQGLVSGDGRMLFSPSIHSSTLIDYKEPAWYNRVYGIFRYKTM